jgi:hypothetical protein
MSVTLLLLVGLILGGCAKMGPEMWAGNPVKDSYECERDATAAGSAMMDASPLVRLIFGIKSTRELYDDCMKARGFQRRVQR